MDRIKEAQLLIVKRFIPLLERDHTYYLRSLQQTPSRFRAEYAYYYGILECIFDLEGHLGKELPDKKKLKVSKLWEMQGYLDYLEFIMKFGFGIEKELVRLPNIDKVKEDSNKRREYELEILEIKKKSEI